jgi:hypothetical protein
MKKLIASRVTDSFFHSFTMAKSQDKQSCGTTLCHIHHYHSALSIVLAFASQAEENEMVIRQKHPKATNPFHRCPVPSDFDLGSGNDGRGSHQATKPWLLHKNFFATPILLSWWMVYRLL